ncbi:glycosyltransferase family 4 protein [Coraliomargarita sp. SDUM461004]|uniref:Glycosyltransferase family 4 protein n=1 Tax=Thalassobacterium sedimentorum TaxID=3041258 RepID=A0ABU1ALB8_9BACT|nr:glycosyltransferase family 4 protein [Coraliomargarita sp. SDUM461004]MDQ8195590.1 glycosyltransferase family 4 protein [Coraliomargarita sp. SDUM461004]
MKPKVVISTGVGRLHFVETVESLPAGQVDCSVISGWVPSKSMMVILGWLPIYGSNRSLADRLKPRLRFLKTGARVHSLFLPEFERLYRKLLSKIIATDDLDTATKVWELFGKQSIPFLTGDIFHTRSGAGQGGAIAAAKAKGMKVIVDQSLAHPVEMERNLKDLYHAHGIHFELGPDKTFWQLVLKDCEEADILLVNSDYVKQNFVDLGYDPEKIRVSYLGVRQDFKGLKQDYALAEDGVLRLLFTGGFGLRKGANVIIDAVQELEQRGIQCRVEVAGNGIQGQALLEAYPDSIKQRFTFHGFIPQDDLKALLQRADMYVFPSYAEGCAKSAAEAMAAGLPVICTKETGIPSSEVETHCVVERGSVSALVDSIVDLAKNESRRREIGLAGAVLVAERMTWSNYGQELVELYQELTD